MFDSTEKEIIAGVTYDLITQIAPIEIPIFQITYEMFLENPEKVRTDWDDKLLGFDQSPNSIQDAAFLTPVLLSIIAEVIKFIRGEVQRSFQGNSSILISDAIKNMFKRFRPVERNAENEEVFSLTVDQLERLHKLITKKALQFRLSKIRAKLLADAIIGSLMVTLSK